MILEAVYFLNYYSASLDFKRENIIIIFVVYESKELDQHRPD
jgi:hypothetical protein